MNIHKFISFVCLIIANFLLFSGITLCSTEIPIEQDKAYLGTRISTIRSKLSQVKRDNRTNSLDWNTYADAFLDIFMHEKDLMFVYEMTDWLLRDTPNDRWSVPEEDIRQLLTDTQQMLDREAVRLKLLDLLLFKAQIADYSKSLFTRFLFDPMPSIRRRMIQTLREDGQEEAILELEKAIALLKSKPSLSGSDLEEIALISEAIKNIHLWADRLESKWTPNEAEIHQQAEMIKLRLPRGWLDGIRPPGFMDGSKYIIDRWARYKWGARYFLDSKDVSMGNKSLFVDSILTRVHPQDWNEAFNLIMKYYDQLTNENNMMQKHFVVSTILSRNSVEDLRRLSGLLTSEELTDAVARQDLIDKHSKIGTEVCLPELRHAADFWKEKGENGWVKTIEEAIQAIEQRLGVTPQVNPVHSSE